MADVQNESYPYGAPGSSQRAAMAYEKAQADKADAEARAKADEPAKAKAEPERVFVEPAVMAPAVVAPAFADEHDREEAYPLAGNAPFGGAAVVEHDHEDPHAE